METYKTLLQPANAVFTEKKSEFIATIVPAKTERQALDILEQTRTAHRKARHNCYAYLIRGENIQRCCDDGEPSGTAGKPIFEVLQNRELCDVICIVTRYFGGVLLGAGGLTRAYSNAASLAVKDADIVEIQPAQVVQIKADYSRYRRIAAAIGEFGGFAQSENFSDVTEVTAVVPLETADEFVKKLIDSCHGAIFVENIRKYYCDFGKTHKLFEK